MDEDEIQRLYERYFYSRRVDEIKRLREKTGVKPKWFYGRLQLFYEIRGKNEQFDDIRTWREATGIEPSHITIYCIKAELLRSRSFEALERFDESTGVREKVEVEVKYS